MPKSFEQRFSDLSNFQQEYGHCNPNFSDHDQSLVHWCHNARTSYRQIMEGTKPLIKLTPEQISRMEDIGFKFRTSLMKPYHEFYQDLLAFKAIHGHCNVPASYRDQELVKWCRKQREAYAARMNRNDDLSRRGINISLERIQRLEQIGFKWDEVEEINENESLFGRQMTNNSVSQNKVKISKRSSTITKEEMTGEDDIDGNAQFDKKLSTNVPTGKKKFVKKGKDGDAPRAPFASVPINLNKVDGQTFDLDIQSKNSHKHLVNAGRKAPQRLTRSSRSSTHYR